jgi:hypothetical protein
MACCSRLLVSRLYISFPRNALHKKASHILCRLGRFYVCLNLSRDPVNFLSCESVTPPYISLDRNALQKTPRHIVCLLKFKRATHIDLTFYIIIVKLVIVLKNVSIHFSLYSKLQYIYYC